MRVVLCGSCVEPPRHSLDPPPSFTKKKKGRKQEERKKVKRGLVASVRLVRLARVCAAEIGTLAGAGGRKQNVHTYVRCTVICSSDCASLDCCCVISNDCYCVLLVFSSSSFFFFFFFFFSSSSSPRLLLCSFQREIDGM